MRVVLQRVSMACVTQVASTPPRSVAIDQGLVLLAGFRAVDDAAVLQWMAQKCATLRVFEDAAGAMNRSVGDVGGAILVVPNFTLYDDAGKGRRPSFTAAAPPAQAQALIEAFVACVQGTGVPVHAGFFQTHMQVALTNDGPVTLFLER
jgi:D-tyrosyl-tRNA(Tyr) deacylase